METNLQSEDRFKKWRHDGKHVDLNLNWLSKVQEVSTYWNIRRNHSLTREKDVLDIGDVTGNWGYESKRGHFKTIMWSGDVSELLWIEEIHQTSAQLNKEGYFGGMKTCWKIKYESEGGDSFVKWKCLLRVNIIGKWARIWNMHRHISSRGTYWTLETWWKRGWFRKWRQICEVSVERKSEKKKTFSNQAGIKKVFVASKPGVFHGVLQMFWLFYSGSRSISICGHYEQTSIL